MSFKDFYMMLAAWIQLSLMLAAAGFVCGLCYGAATVGYNLLVGV